MKFSTLAFLFLFSSPCFGSVRVELDSLKALPVPEWASIRDRILAQGTECTNELGVIRDNYQEPWQVRFLASLCLERILNDPSETEFFGTPWKSDPDFDPAWISTAAGYSLEEIDLLRRRLREKGYWFGLLDQFAFPDDCGDRHPVFHIGAQILFDDAPEAVRQYAARLSECYASESLIRHDWHYDGYVPWLEAYVLDGTYPQGSTLLLEHLENTGCRFPAKLRILLSRNEDESLLERIRDSPETDRMTRGLVGERLSQLTSRVRESPSPKPIPPVLSDSHFTFGSEPKPDTQPTEEDSSPRRLRRGSLAALVLLAISASLVCFRNHRWFERKGSAS